MVSYMSNDYKIYDPPKANWSCMLNGDENFQIHIMSAPNAFHRLLQRLLLGIRYKRIEYDKQNREN